jgi:hypothetical protein
MTNIFSSSILNKKKRGSVNGKAISSSFPSYLDPCKLYDEENHQSTPKASAKRSRENLKDEKKKSKDNSNSEKKIKKIKEDTSKDHADFPELKPIREELIQQLSEKGQYKEIDNMYLGALMLIMEEFKELEDGTYVVKFKNRKWNHHQISQYIATKRIEEEVSSSDD